MKPIRYAFFGTPDFAVFALEELAAAGTLPALIVTAPDKPVGRGLVLTPPAVKVWALEHGISFIQPIRFDDETLAQLTGFDVFLIVAYGKILPERVLALPAHGCLNIHPSLLPKYRGPSPLESQILADEPHVGVSLMVLDEEVDHGPVLIQEVVPIPEWPIDAERLTEMLGRIGGRMAAQALPEWVEGTIEAKDQDHSQATCTKKIRKEDGRIDLSAPARENYLKYLAYKGWPDTHFFAMRGGKEVRVKIAKASYENDAFVIERVVPEGKKEMAYTDFLRSEPTQG